MQARGTVGYGEFVAANLWSSDELRSGVKENLRRRREVAISEALHQHAVQAAALLKQAQAMAKQTRKG